MITQTFLGLIEKHADTLTKDLVQEFRTRKETMHYRDLPDEVLYTRVHKVLFNVYTRLENWLSKTKPKDTLFAYYRGLGRERRQEDIPLEEVVMVLMLIKRRIWKFIVESKTFASGYEQQDLFDLNYNVGLFFDRIVLAIITGYQEEMRAGS
jgi:hypothetical protein